MTDSQQGYQVTVNTLTTDANLWDAQADRMTAIVSRVTGVRMDRTQGGPFQVIVSAYAEVCDAVSDRSKEGHDSMVGISAGLRTTATNYQQQDQQAADNINSIGRQGGIG
ncbi:type VII secretion target [Kitasatospora sp. NPDC006697]|uniref:type VII secretion target n=1 Tax=Kitasatospora sp. NPDC006697 TaxID=3364020 RepID=UPI0036CFB145